MFPYDSVWAMKSEGLGLIVGAISFQDFQPMWSWSTNVIDKRTDRQTTCDPKTALCTIVHRAVKTGCVVVSPLPRRTYGCHFRSSQLSWWVRVRVYNPGTFLNFVICDLMHSVVHFCDYNTTPIHHLELKWRPLHDQDYGPWFDVCQ